MYALMHDCAYCTDPWYSEFGMINLCLQIMPPIELLAKIVFIACILRYQIGFEIERRLTHPWCIPTPGQGTQCMPASSPSHTCRPDGARPATRPERARTADRLERSISRMPDRISPLCSNSLSYTIFSWTPAFIFRPSWSVRSMWE